MDENQQNTDQAPSAMSVGLRYGLILAAVSISYMLIRIVAGSSPFEQDWLAYVSFIFIIGAIVLAHKYYKDNGDGFMSFGQGFGVGFLTCLVSTIVGMIFSYIYINFIDQSIFDAIWEKAAADMEEKGQSEEAIEMGLEWGKKLFWVFYLVGSLFWGTLITLIVTIFTQKKRPETF